MYNLFYLQECKYLPLYFLNSYYFMCGSVLCHVCLCTMEFSPDLLEEQQASHLPAVILKRIISATV